MELELEELKAAHRRIVVCRYSVVAHILPIRRTACDIRCAAVLVLIPVTLTQAPPVELVQSLFDLTPAEARVARGLAAGETVQGLSPSGRSRRAPHRDR